MALLTFTSILYSKEENYGQHEERKKQKWKLVYSIVDEQYLYELNDSGHWKIWTQSVNDLGYFSVIYCAKSRSHTSVSFL